MHWLRFSFMIQTLLQLASVPIIMCEILFSLELLSRASFVIDGWCEQLYTNQEWVSSTWEFFLITFPVDGKKIIPPINILMSSSICCQLSYFFFFCCAVISSKTYRKCLIRYRVMSSCCISIALLLNLFERD